MHSSSILFLAANLSNESVKIQLERAKSTYRDSDVT